MRIYCAGVYHGNRTSQRTTSIHMRVTQNYQYPYVLESFYYADDYMMQLIRRNKQSIFLDSGAFSMFTAKIKIDLKKYVAFIKRHRDVIHMASNLDVIGEGHEQETYDRQKQLEDMVGETGLIGPVHHVRDDDKWLRRYLDEGYDYIFLGGMVPESAPVLKQWLDHVWHYYLTNDDGTPKVKVHGFGLTTNELMFRYPWYSIDSTAWVMNSRYGILFMDFQRADGTVKDRKIAFSDRSNARYDLNSWHFNSLKPDEQEVICARLDELEVNRIREPKLEADFEHRFKCKLGYNPQALGCSYGMRDMANMEYFKRAMDRRIDKFTRKQDTLF